MTKKYEIVDEPAPQPVHGFFIKCTGCGGADIQVVNGIRRGSDETGVYGDIKLRCRLCGFDAAVYEP